MPTLRTQLDALAANFAQQIILAIQGASLQELIAPSGREIRNGSKELEARIAVGGGSRHEPLSTPKRRGKNGRLARRSADEIEATLNKIVLLVKGQKAGMRAEEIRRKLGMEPKEMPRILKEGIATKKLTSKGQKRATTYFAR
jgi:hypothetical protein